MELLDLYDENLIPLGHTHVRGEKIADGEYVLAALVWTVNSHGEILTTLRSPEKADCPNLWENTGGAVRAGETPEEGCMRELFEETGIEAKSEELTLIDVHRGKTTFYFTFAVKRDISAGKICLQPGETAGAKWVSVKKFEEMCADGSVAPPICAGYGRVRAKLFKFIKNCMD